VLRFDDVKAGWEQKILLRSDAHHDNIKNDWGLEKKHLEKAKECNAPILDFGDMFCAMQGKYDPRKDMNQLKPEHKVQGYLDAIVKSAADDYAPYAKNFAVFGRGNHESSILNRLGTDLISNMVHRMNSENKSNVYAGGYSGWIILSFKIRRTVRHTLKLHYFHGAGGGGPVTRGVIQTNRMAVYLPDADIVVSGHTHDSWVVPIRRLRISDRNVIHQDNQYHVRTGTYKDDFSDGHEGWHVETGKPPKSMGAVWMKLQSDGDKVIPTFEIDLK
jgi:hypothetical protein